MVAPPCASPFLKLHPYLLSLPTSLPLATPAVWPLIYLPPFSASNPLDSPSLGPELFRRREMGVKASIGGLLGGLFKGTDSGEYTRQQYASTVALISSLEPEMSAMSDSELRDKTSVLGERAQLSESLDTLLPEAFSVAREASGRVLGLGPFDVQLIGGIVLHKGEIAEMKTGEGKTLLLFYHLI